MRHSWQARLQALPSEQSRRIMSIGAAIRIVTIGPTILAGTTDPIVPPTMGLHAHGRVHGIAIVIPNTGLSTRAPATSPPIVDTSVSAANQG